MGYDSLSTWHQLGRPAAVYFDVGRYSNRAREVARMRPGKLLSVPSRGWELVRAWRTYRSGA